MVHHPKLYWMHKFHHEAVNTVALAFQYFDLLDWLLVNNMAILLGPLILGSKCHVVTAITFFLYGFANNIDDHCGYDFPWMFSKCMPWIASNDFHSYHHKYGGGNYGTFTIFWDCIFGTCKDYIEHFEKMENKKMDKNTITKI